VLKDIQELSLSLKIEGIKVMKNSSFENMLKQRVIEKTLQDLNRRKKSHSNVMMLDHKYLKMTKYCMP
jgi:ASC-1-like (ASCH) protein